MSYPLDRKLIVEFIGMFMFVFTVGMATNKAGAGALAPLAIGSALCPRYVGRSDPAFGPLPSRRNNHPVRFAPARRSPAFGSLRNRGDSYWLEIQPGISNRRRSCFKHPTRSGRVIHSALAASTSPVNFSAGRTWRNAYAAAAPPRKSASR